MLALSEQDYEELGFTLWVFIAIATTHTSSRAVEVVERPDWLQPTWRSLLGAKHRTKYEEDMCSMAEAICCDYICAQLWVRLLPATVEPPNNGRGRHV